MMESLERTVGSWEWRQWRPRAGTELPELGNPPLFQTLDVEALNVEGPRREALLEWIAEDPDAVLARRARVPEALSAPSLRAREGLPRPELDLSDLPGRLEDRAPALREALDTVGCPGCHARAPSFVQTGIDRTFSPFYERELQARRRALDAFAEGTAERPPFGALQDGAPQDP